MADEASENQIAVRLTFPNPDGVPEIATALAYAGFPDVTLYVVVEASATDKDTDLQVLHDRMKDLAPMIEGANGGAISHVTRDGWTQAPAP